VLDTNTRANNNILGHFWKGEVVPVLKHLAIKMYTAVKVKLHTFLTSLLMDMSNDLTLGSIEKEAG
jgi:hypothetical protein